MITVCASLWAAHKVTPLNVKTGLWEVTTTNSPNNDVMLPAALLEKLTPEERARVEERIKARKADPQKTTTTRLCLTRKEVERGLPFRPVGKSCTWTALTSTSSEVEMRGECLDQGVKTERTLRIEALGREEATGWVQFSTKGDNATFSFTSTFKAKWMGQLCRSR